MTIINDIRACLDTHLTNTSGIPSIARQNVPFKPTNGVPYVQATFNPTSRRPAVRGLNPQQRYEGIYTILVATPEGLGSGAGYDYADLLLDRFNSTTDIVYTNPTDTILIETGDTLLLQDGGSMLLGSPTYVSIEYSEVRGSFLDSPFYFTPVVVSWYAYF